MYSTVRYQLIYSSQHMCVTRNAKLETRNRDNGRSGEAIEQSGKEKGGGRCECRRKERSAGASGRNNKHNKSAENCGGEGAAGWHKER